MTPENVVFLQESMSRLKGSGYIEIGVCVFMIGLLILMLPWEDWF